MKIFAILFLTFYTLSNGLKAASSVGGVDGFFNIPWSASQADAEKIMLSREGVKKSANSDDKLMIFTGGIVANDPVGFYLLMFVDGKFCKGIVTLEVNKNRPIDEYKTVKTLLAEKYGKPDKDTAFYSYPYKEGDGHEEIALRLEKAIYSCHWDFPPTSSLFCRITKDLKVLIAYENTGLFKVYTEKENLKIKSDL